MPAKGNSKNILKYPENKQLKLKLVLQKNIWKLDNEILALYFSSAMADKNSNAKYFFI